jgi:hypothetical protein
MNTDDCRCEFSEEYADGDEPSWHYARTCGMCGFKWGSLHCAHDGVQHPCPQCGWIGLGKRTPGQLLFGP